VISVLLPTYNQAVFLPDALAGIDAQTFRDFELIVCDDGSTDNTPSILKRHRGRAVIHEENRGTAAAINSAAALAAGGLLTWVSSDNVMRPDWLARLVAEMDEATGAVFSDYHWIDTELGDSRTVCVGEYEPDRLLKSEACYFGPSFLIRREVWTDHRGGTSHDYDHWARVEEACWLKGLAIRRVPAVLCDYRRGPWAVCRRRPDLYDAGKWRAHAIERRKLTRNWLGNLVADRVRLGDEVLDLGCGIMPATGGRLNVKRHVGVDCFQTYLERIGPPTVLGNLPDVARRFGGRSFDVVLMLDVVEHLEKPDAIMLIREAERIARREVVVFTPDGFCPQGPLSAWGMGENAAQSHRCGFTFDELAGMGYACSRHRNGSQQGEILSVFGTKCPTRH
jgi:hypothetical protein